MTATTSRLRNWLSAAQLLIVALAVTVSAIGCQSATDRMNSMPYEPRSTHDVYSDMRLEQMRLEAMRAQDAERVPRSAGLDQFRASESDPEAARAERQAEIDRLFERIFELRMEQNYPRALELVEQVLFIDPNNYAAQVLKVTMEDNVLYKRADKVWRDRSLEVAESGSSDAKDSVPYADIVTFPTDWPQLTEAQKARVREIAKQRSSKQDPQELLKQLREEARRDRARRLKEGQGQDLVGESRTVMLQERARRAAFEEFMHDATELEAKGKFDEARQAINRAELVLNNARRVISPKVYQQKLAEVASRRTALEQRTVVATRRVGAHTDDKLPPYELGPGEELWIIVSNRTDANAARVQKREPNAGRLITRRPAPNGDGTIDVPLPLQHTDVKANVTGYIAAVDVTQQYGNPFSEPIEAVYVFPLPEDAAVSSFVMTIGDRRIRGIIREREQAERIYDVAVSRGHTASILTQERPNVFTQKVGNIQPGHRIDIALRYFNTLAYEDGDYTLTFPMVVGPRYNPSGTTDGIGAVARGRSSGQATDVTYLAPDERSGHDIALSVNLDAAVPLHAIESVNHAVSVQREGDSRVTVDIKQGDTVPNKDFVLRWRVTDDTTRGGMIVQKTDRGDFFSLMLYPPRELHALDRQPMEIVFVLDCSGSMRGKPIEQAKAGVIRGLQSLEKGDTFQVIRFSEASSSFGGAPVDATPDNIQNAVKYVESLEGSGSTEMIEGIKAALDFPHDPQRLRVVAFMTDGFIGNEVEILGEVHEKLGRARVFSFGVGQAPNRFLLSRMAHMGRGASTFVSLNDSATQPVDAFMHRISHPAMTDVTIDFGNVQVDRVYPRRIGDLIVGRPILLTGRFIGDVPDDAVVKVEGRTPKGAVSINVPLTVAARTQDEVGSPALPAVWARMRIKELVNQSMHTPDRHGELRESITKLSLEYQIMSSYTSYLAVDSATRLAGGSKARRVPQAIPVPQGVMYDQTVE